MPGRSGRPDLSRPAHRRPGSATGPILVRRNGEDTVVDDNADRVHVPGQHGMPERDIEPLWPPEQIDGFGAPTWAAPPVPPTVPPPPAPPSPAQPTNQPPVTQPTDPPPVAGPAYPPQVAGPVYPSTTAEPQHVPGRPTHAPGAPPSPADYPSLTNGAPSATGWEPAPRPGPGQVDLDLPFTLDRPTAVAPTRDGGRPTPITRTRRTTRRTWSTRVPRMTRPRRWPDRRRSRRGHIHRSVPDPTRSRPPKRRSGRPRPTWAAGPTATRRAAAA